MERFINARAESEDGLVLILLAPEDAAIASDLPQIHWGGRLRRLDVSIWADLHSPFPPHPEPMSTLATQLAVELCGWRLDLVAEIARARQRDLLDPLGWLRARSGEETPVSGFLDGRSMPCPVALIVCEDEGELRRRIWRAQLTALFPWIEEQRQKVIDRHGNWLHVNDHLLKLGVRDREDIDFGAIARQLRSRVSPREAELLECFARLRNDLAHRKPADPDDLDLAFREAEQFGLGTR